MERVCTLDELPAGAVRRVVVGGVPVALFNLGGEILAIDDTCSHALASLSEGYLDDDKIECPKHGSQFDVRTGDALSLPATRPVAKHSVTVKDDEIYVEA